LRLNSVNTNLHALRVISNHFWTSPKTDIDIESREIGLVLNGENIHCVSKQVPTFKLYV